MGEVVLPRASWVPHSAAQRSNVALLIGLAEGVSTAEGEAAIQPVADRFGAPDVQDRDEYVQSVASEVDQMLTIIYVLLVMAIVIALMGIANTLSLSIHERTRELGLLRAVGQSRRQLRSMVRAISAAEGRGSFTRPAGQLAVVLALGALVGIVAAVRPARRAAKLDVLQAIATD